EYFLQDQVYLFGDRLSVLAGARFSRTEAYSTNKRTNTTQLRIDESWNPRYGLVWLPQSAASIYLNFSQLSSALLFTNPDGRRFSPTVAELAESGVRFEVLDRRLFLTASLYQLRNTGTLVPDPGRPDYFIATGEQRTRGLEFDFVGKPAKNWQMVGSANVADAFFSRHTGEFQGNRRINTPSHTYSLWNRYDVTHGALHGTWIGIGFLRLSGRYGDAANSFYIPPYYRVDVSVGYQASRWDVALMIKNVSDQNYIRATSSELSVYPGSPREYSFRLRLRF
ncbi:MAG TPA: TonB-dependent receptor, partial [Opitutaceae bacterium]|nr:TonB-dependent receptor [Opitutaceae bacterium]